MWFSGVPVGSDPSPDLIVYHQHPDLLHLLSQLLDVIADQAVFNIHICPVVEQVQRACNIDFKGCRHMMGFLFLLLQKRLIQILKNRHIFRPGIVEILLVNLMNTAVNDRLFHRLEAVLSAHHKLAQGKNKIRFQGNGIVLL